MCRTVDRYDLHLEGITNIVSRVKTIVEGIYDMSIVSFPDTHSQERGGSLEAACVQRKALKQLCVGRYWYYVVTMTFPL